MSAAVLTVREAARRLAALRCAALRLRTCAHACRGLDVLIGCLASHKLVSEIAVAGCETLGGTCVGQGKGD